MAYREYIGSRYVPIFGRKNEESIQWDNGSSYEPLTVVLYQGNSYTSRQYVPAGVDILDTQYWAETGNYNAQVEAYRNEVLQYDNRITATENGLQNVPTLIEQASAGLLSDIYTDGNLIVRTSATVQGTCILVSADDDAFILIDAGTKYGTIDDTAAVVNWLDTILQSKKLAAFVISHFHPDHCAAITEVATSHCDAQTKFFMQMSLPNDTVSGDLQYYNEQRSKFISAATAAGATAVTPVQGTVYNFGEENNPLQLMFANTNSAYINTYENIVKSDNGYSNDTISINNYSLITHVTYAGSRYVNCADVETPAQVENIEIVQPATFASYPHHGVNMMGYHEFFNKLGTKFYHLTRPLDVQTGSVASITAAIRWSYLIRYSSQIQMPVIFDNTRDFKCVMHMGDIMAVTGNELSVPSTRDNDNNVPLVSNVLPKANIYNIDNPFVIATYTLEDLIKESSELGKDVSFHFNGKVGYVADMPAYTKAIEVFKWNSENASIDSDMGNNPPIIYYTSGNPATVYLGNINAVMNMFTYSTSFNSEQFPNTQWKPAYPVAGSVRNITGLVLTEGSTSGTNANFARLFRNNSLIAAMELTENDTNNVYPLNVPITRRATNQWSGNSNVSTTGWLFVDVRHEPNANTIKLNTAKWVNFAGVEVGTVKLTGIVNPVSI